MKKVFFTWPGMGDGLTLLCAAWNYYKINKEKPYIGIEKIDFAQYCDFLEPIDWINFTTLSSDKKNEVMNKATSLEYEPVFLDSSNYQYLAPLYEKNIIKWSKKHLVENLCSAMGLNGEIDLNFSFNTKIKREVKENNYVCVMCGGLQKYKYIAPEQMQEIVNYLINKFTVIQLGGGQDPLLSHVKDYRNKSLIESWNLLHNANFFVGGIGGLVHMARFAGTKSVILQTSGEPIGLTPYKGDILVEPNDKCTLCADGLSNPLFQRCYFKYKCIRNVRPKDVINKIEENLSYLCSKEVTKHRAIITANPSSGINNFNDFKRTIQYGAARFF